MAKRENGTGSIVRRKRANGTKYVAYAPATYEEGPDGHVRKYQQPLGSFSHLPHMVAQPQESYAHDARIILMSQRGKRLLPQESAGMGCGQRQHPEPLGGGHVGGEKVGRSLLPPVHEPLHAAAVAEAIQQSHELTAVQ